MEEQLLRQIASGLLRPLFSGAEILPGSKASHGRNCVAFVDPCTIDFKVHETDKYRLSVHRSQAFAKKSGIGVTEIAVVEAFVRVLREIAPGLEKNYGDDLLASFQRRVVAKAAATGAEPFEKLLLEAIDQFAMFANRQYEGHQIAAAVGLTLERNNGGVQFREMFQKDFSVVLSNGVDTLLTFDRDGRLAGYVSLDKAATPTSFSPYRQSPIAAWAKDRNVALVLNRLGEILLFRDEKLLFVRRSGVWHFLTHEPVLTQMGGYSHSVRRAIYESCLDASFARTGACVGLISSGYASKWGKVVPSQDDHLDAEASIKARTISRVLEERPFQDLDRRLRQELLAIDGATLVGHNGKVLAVGAILKIPGGSTGGGRLAAAKALSKYGVGIKVSQDGPIRGFRLGRKEPKFVVM